MAKEKAKTVFPGDFVTTEEEFAAGKNVFEKDGEIRASLVGEPRFDEEAKEVSIKGNGMEMLKKGDIVIGRVTKVTDSMVSADILGSTEKRGIGITRGKLPVRNASQEFVEDMKDLFKIGDYIKAKVSMATRLAVDLATNEKGLGVVEAHCRKCRSKMDFNNGRMTCLVCGNSGQRKWFETEYTRGGGKHNRNDRNKGFSKRGRGGRPGRDSRRGRDSQGRGKFNKKGGFRNENRGNKPRNRRY